MKNIAIILAGGAGNRLGGDTPKQFLEVGGKPVIAYSMDVFEQCTRIDEITVVVSPAHMDLWKAIAAEHNWTKLKKTVAGGTERSDSTKAALKIYEDIDEANLLFHDAARPLVTARITGDTLDSLAVVSAVTVAIPTSDTILQVDDTHQLIAAIPSRSALYRMQTPQGFKLSVIRKAYELAAADPYFKATDDCGVIHKYLPGEKIGIVKGDEKNLKITWPQDLQLAEYLLSSLTNY